jgi:hemerythrin-like domain-containing protein
MLFEDGRSPRPAKLEEPAMRPTDVLSAEHRVIEQVLDCLETIASSARDLGLLDARLASEALTFLIEFADRMHHGKEELHLFPLMASRGIPRNVGPIAVMLNEHDIGRAEIAKMRTAIQGASTSRESVSEFIAAAFAYVELLREHIAKEDSVLFPMAESVLRDDDRAQALAAFERVERDSLGDGGRARLIASANELATQLGVAQGAGRSNARRVHGCGSMPRA